MDETLNGKTCHKCGGADHFGSQCRTKTAKLPNLDGKRRQKERKRRGQSGMWEVKEMKMSMYLL